MLFKKKSKNTDDDNYIVALDIGTEFAKALIAKIDGDRLEIIGVGRAHQDLGNMYSGAVADITGVVRNCEVALTQAEEQAGLQARKAVAGIAGEFVKGVTSTIRYRRPQANRNLDEVEMQVIISKVQERAAKKAQKQIAIETGNPDVEVKLVNSAIVGIHIDGYKVTNPIGFQGRDVVVQIYTAFAPMVHIGALERVAAELDLELIAVAAEPFAVARAVLGNDGNSNFTAILADIGGGTTDVAVINDGGVEGTKMIGVAGRSFTKSIERDLNISYEAAERLKINLNNPRIKPGVLKKLDLAVDKTLDVWMAGFGLALSEFDVLDQLPSRILMCGGGSSLSRLIDRLSQDDWYADLPFTKRPSVHLISPDNVVGIEDGTGDVRDHTMITAMGLLRVGYDTIISVDDDGSIKSKIDKMLRI
jgi:cell division protein FtsA